MPDTDSPALDAAYDFCMRLARSHYENFPVGSWLLPAALRPHIAVFYRFARAIDDIADSPALAPADKTARLDAFQAALVHGSDDGALAIGPEDEAVGHAGHRRDVAREVEDRRVVRPTVRKRLGRADVPLRAPGEGTWRCPAAGRRRR